jgi:hypothetical protein
MLAIAMLRIFIERIRHMLCPRCQRQHIPNNITPGKYPGALSRTDNKTEVCRACGLEEAMLVFAFKELQPVSSWPVRREG